MEEEPTTYASLKGKKFEKRGASFKGRPKFAPSRKESQEGGPLIQ